MNKKTLKLVKFYVLILFFFFAVLLQLSNVYLYHDDYGYLTLSYANINIQGISGTNYGIKEIFQFLYAHYMTWGGRILYFFIEIILGKESIWGLRIAQSIITALLIYIIAQNSNSGKSIFKLIIVIAAYFALSIQIVNDSLYWFTASVLYLYPLLPFFTGCLLFYKCTFGSLLTQSKKIIMYVSLFLASFSQEQISCATVFFTTSCIMLNYIYTHKKTGIQNNSKLTTIVSLILTYTGFLILMLSPGSWKRAAIENSGLIERILSHTINILLHFYYESGRIFQLIIIFVFMCIIYSLHKTKSVNIFYTIFCLIISLLLFFSNIIFGVSCYEGIIALTGDNQLITGFILICHMLIIITATLLYCIKIKRDFKTLLFLLSGYITLLFIIISPSAVPYRASLPFCFTLIFTISDMTAYIFRKKSKNFTTVCICLLFIFSTFNYYTIYKGYKENSIVHIANDNILKNSNNNTINNTLVLYKDINDMYGTTTPYEAEYIQNWIKKYYSIPDSIQFNYIDYK